MGGGLLFLTLWLSEQDMQTFREKNVQKEAKKKLPCVEFLLFPGGTLRTAQLTTAQSNQS